MKPGRIFQSPEVRNLRDFGGWRTTSDRKLASGRLLRSGHWADSKQHAHGLLRQLNPDVFVDLRRPAERKYQPSVLPDDVAIEVLASPGGDQREPPHVRFLREGNLTKASVRAYMHSAYRRIPTETHHLSLFRQTILQLSEGKTVLIHCAAGKDRTGILAALILGLLEVSQDTIMEDYLLTNDAVDIEGLLPVITAQISKRLDIQIAADVLYPMLGVEADFLLEAQKIIGDPMVFAKTKLDLSADDIAQLQNSLLVSN